MHLDDFHRIEMRTDRATGLRAIFALHDLTLGPALGGIRRWAYADDNEALADVVRLARGMTAKNALADLPFGGGKSVVMAPGSARPGHRCGPPSRAITVPELHKLGEWIDDLGGDYVAAEDVGMRVSDLVTAGTRTAHVTGIGRAGLGGDPGPRTALGVFTGIRVVAKRLGFPNLAGLRVAVQGLGSVGMALCKRLHDAGARLAVADIDAAKVARAKQRFGATAIPVAGAMLADVDVVAPCALGGAVTVEVAQEMPARAIAGSANNQIACPQAADTLRRRGILYAPDYIINAGGVISAGLEYLGRDGFDERVRGIGRRLERIFDEAQATGQSEAKVAENMTQRVLASATERREAHHAPAALASVA